MLIHDVITTALIAIKRRDKNIEEFLLSGSQEIENL
jgi:hypothetical protein